MKTSLARHFAEAIADITAEGNADEFFNQIKSVSEVIGDNIMLCSFLEDKSIGITPKKRVIKKLFRGQIPDLLLNTLYLLVDIGRVIIIGDIVSEYRKITDTRRNILNITATSTIPLEQDQLERIKEKYRKLYNAQSARIETGTDESLMGGVVVRIGNRIFDASVKGRLSCLEKTLISTQKT